jgi:hypothetical protein
VQIVIVRRPSNSGSETSDPQFHSCPCSDPPIALQTVLLPCQCTRDRDEVPLRKTETDVFVWRRQLAFPPSFWGPHQAIVLLFCVLVTAGRRPHLQPWYHQAVTLLLLCLTMVKHSNNVTTYHVFTFPMVTAGRLLGGYPSTADLC